MQVRNYILRIYFGPTPFQRSSLPTTVNWGATYWDLKREYCDGGIFRDGDKFDLFYTFNVDDRPLEEIRERWGIPSNKAARQRKSRINKEMVARRDELFSYFLITVVSFAKRGEFCRFPENPGRSEEWIKRLKRSVQPGVWLNGVAADGKNVVALRSLTTGLRHAPAHIYLAAIHKDFRHIVKVAEDYPPAFFKFFINRYFYRRLRYKRSSLYGLGEDFDEFLQGRADAFTLIQLLGKLTELPSRALRRTLQRNRYIACPLMAYPTELSSLNKAIAEVRDDYVIWLISTSLPNDSRIIQGLWG
jgi:hypothetical protein